MLEPGKTKIPVAKILKTHGIKGELNVELTDEAEPDEDFRSGAVVILELDGLDVPFFVGSVRPRGADSLLLTLDDVDSEREAASLVGKTIYIYADLDNSEEMTAGDLIGFSLVAVDESEPIGTVEALTELTPGAWYFVLDGGRLIPVVDEFILSVDSERREVMVELPEGLLDL